MLTFCEMCGKKILAEESVIVPFNHGDFMYFCSKRCSKQYQDLEDAGVNVLANLFKSMFCNDKEHIKTDYIKFRKQRFQVDNIDKD